jgi:hypothetical protein
MNYGIYRLWHLPDEKFNRSIRTLEAHEDFEICHAIKAILEARESDKKSNIR